MMFLRRTSLSIDVVVMVVVTLTSLVSSVTSGSCPGGYVPLRLYLNSSLLSSLHADPSACYETGSVVLNTFCSGNCANVTCTADQVVHPAYVTSPCGIGIMNNISALIESTLCIPGPRSATNFFDSCVDTSTISAPYDHVVFLTMRPTQADGVVAVQQRCGFEQLSGRPTSSVINIEPTTFNKLMQKSPICSGSAATTTTTSAAGPTPAEVFKSQLLHFVIHVLGFDVVQMLNWRVPGTTPPTLYAQYPNASAPLYPYGPVMPMDAKSASVMFNTSQNGVGFYNTSLINATHRVMLVTPNVVALARTYFNCPSLKGVLLEELGAADMHWERRVLNYELMTSEYSMSDYPPLSPFTLAAMVDTGFYVLSNGAIGDDYTWGKTRGCLFLEANCSSLQESWGDAFCQGVAGFAYDRSFISGCGNHPITDAKFLQPAYQHFPNNPTMGGFDPYSDFCPYADNTSSLVIARCTLPPANGTNVDTVYSNMSGKGVRAAYTSMINQMSLLQGDRSPFAVVPRCMQFLCLNTSSMLFRVGDSWYQCPPYPQLTELTFPPSAALSPQQQPFNATAATVSYQFYGQIQCPPLANTCNSGVSPSQSDLYGVNGFFTSSYCPRLVNITPTSGPLAGGTTVTVAGTNLLVNSAMNPIHINCKGLLIGGQPTNFSTYEYLYAEAVNGTYVHYFTVNTTTVPVDGLLGGSAEDGSGAVDVELLCIVEGAMVCGSAYQQYCGVDRWLGAYTLIAPPPPPPSLGFLATTLGQAVVGLCGVVLLGIILLIAAVCTQRSDEKKLAAQTSEDSGKALLGDDESKEDVELVPVVAATSTDATGAGQRKSEDRPIVTDGTATKEISSTTPGTTSERAASAPSASPLASIPLVVATASKAEKRAPPKKAAAAAVILLSDDDEEPPPPPPPGDDDEPPPPPPPDDEEEHIEL